jgi:hypothetical protein
MIMEHVTITSLPNGMMKIVPDAWYELVINDKAYSEVVVSSIDGITVRESSAPPVPPTPVPTDPLERAKVAKVNAIEAYDKSDSVNSFTLGGQKMWLTVEEREQIATQISANEAVGRNTMTRWFGGHDFTFPLATWKQMLVALEVYAGDALNVTESHKAAVNALESVEAVNAYDITEGYPEKLVF